MSGQELRSLSEPDFSITHSITSDGIPMHAHSEYVVGYYFRGCSRCSIGGIRGVEFQPGNLGLLNPGEAHQDLASRDQRDYVTVKIKQQFVCGLLRDSGCSASSLPAFPTPKLEGDRGLRRICELIRAEVGNQRFGRDVLLRSLVTELTVSLFRRLDLVPAGCDSSVFGREGFRREIRRALEYLHDNYTKEFSLDRVSAAAGLSKYYFGRVFKKSTGFRPHDYMVNLRIEAAKQLLANTCEPAVQIALDLGFSDQSHFSHVFKQFTGLSPTEYRSATNSNYRQQTGNSVQDRAGSSEIE